MANFNIVDPMRFQAIKNLFSMGSLLTSNKQSWDNLELVKKNLLIYMVVEPTYVTAGQAPSIVD